MLDGFYRVAFGKKVDDTVEMLQADLDDWLQIYSEARTHQGRWCFGKTPMQTFLDSADMAREKQNQPTGSIRRTPTTPDRTDRQIKSPLLHASTLSTPTHRRAAIWPLAASDASSGLPRWRR